MAPKYLTPMAMVLSPPAASRFYWFRAGASFHGAAARTNSRRNCCGSLPAQRPLDASKTWTHPAASRSKV
jgi:hypothetical protein